MRRDLSLLIGLLLFFFVTLLIVSTVMTVAGSDPLMSVRANQSLWQRIGGAACYGFGAIIFSLFGAGALRSARNERAQQPRGFEIRSHERHDTVSNCEQNKNQDFKC
jgi:hypothetical protein